MNKLILFAIIAAVLYYFFIYDSCCFKKVCTYKCVQKMYKNALNRIDKLLVKANSKPTSPAIEEIKTGLTDAKEQFVSIQLQLDETGWNNLMALAPLSCKSVKEGLNNPLDQAERALRA